MDHKTLTIHTSHTLEIVFLHMLLPLGSQLPALMLQWPAVLPTRLEPPPAPAAMAIPAPSPGRAVYGPARAHVSFYCLVHSCDARVNMFVVSVVRSKMKLIRNSGGLPRRRGRSAELCL